MTRSPHPLPLAPGALVAVRWPPGGVGTVVELHSRPRTGDEAGDQMAAHYTVLVGGQLRYVRRSDLELLQ